MSADKSPDTAGTNVNAKHLTNYFPVDFQDSFERSIVKSTNGRREVIRNNRNLNLAVEVVESVEAGK